MPTNERHISRLSKTGRKQLLDGVIIPKKPEGTLNAPQPALVIDMWYQTANETPFLYLPPVCIYDTFSSDASGESTYRVPHYSLDVLIAVRTPGNMLIVLTGYFNFALYQWAYYGVSPQYDDEYAPHYWRFMPELPQGWKDDTRADAPIRSVKADQA